MFLGCRFQNLPHSTQRETTHIFQTSFVFCSLFLFFCCQRCLFQFLFFLVGRNVLFYREINWNRRRAFGQFTFQAAPLIDSWPCKYSSCITESTKVHTLTEFVKAVLFRIGTGHSIIFTDLAGLVPLLGSWTCNIPRFSPFSNNWMIDPSKFGDAPLSNVVLTNRSWISHVQKVEDFSDKIS